MNAIKRAQNCILIYWSAITTITKEREKKQNPYWSSLIDKIIILELLLKMKNQFHKQNKTKQKWYAKNPKTINRIDAFTHV